MNKFVFGIIVTIGTALFLAFGPAWIPTCGWVQRQLWPESQLPKFKKVVVKYLDSIKNGGSGSDYIWADAPEILTSHSHTSVSVEDEIKSYSLGISVFSGPGMLKVPPELLFAWQDELDGMKVESKSIFFINVPVTINDEATPREVSLSSVNGNLFVVPKYISKTD